MHRYVSSPSSTCAGGGTSSRPTPLRILVFIRAFGPGGVERIALRLAKGWRDGGADVRLIVGHDDGPMHADAPRYVTAGAWPLVGRRLRTLRLVAAVCREVRARRPDILFCPGNSYTLVAALLRIVLGRICPPVVAKISNDLERRDLPAPARWAYRGWLWAQGRLIGHFAVLSDAMAAEARARLYVPRSRVTVMPNPVLALADLADAAPPRAPGTARRFVAVGRLERQKDYPLMLRAFALGSRPGDTLCILGEGRTRPALERLAADLDIADRVRFAGFRRDVRTALRDHDILLLSSRFEGQPGAVVEALAGGLAIVATRCSAGMASLLDGGALGTLVAVGDRHAFAEAIATVTPGAPDIARAREMARRFTIEAAVPAYLALFAKVSGNPARQPVAALPMKVALS